MPSVVDLFCGVGGLTHGFVQERFNVVAGIDLDPTCRYPYETNNPGANFLFEDIQHYSVEQLQALYPAGDTKILVGCAPCQPFSNYTNRRTPDKKWDLLYTFADLVRGVRPEIVSMENVPALEQHAVFKKFKGALLESGYNVWHGKVRCADYGIPQTRTRLVLLASRLGTIEIIPHTHTPDRHVTVRQAIEHLDPIEAGQTCDTDPLHRASALTPINLRRIRATTEGGGWHEWPVRLRLKCHKRKKGRSYGSVYGRMRWDSPAPTMTTQCNGLGNGRFGHPAQDRAISIREAAIFQTFPEDYEFIAREADFNFSVLARHIGNAVPVRLGRTIAVSIRRHLAEHNLGFANERTDDE